MPPSTGIHRNSQAIPDDLIYTGTCEVSLRRAVLPYADLELPVPGGRIEDLGMGVVIDCDDAARARVLDLGSGRLRRADLTGPVVLFGWLYEGTVRSLLERATREYASGGDDPAAAWWPGALRLLGRTGYSDLTRPLFLRVGFRDVVEDLDLHEDLAIRIALPDGITRAHLDPRDATLHFRPGGRERGGVLEKALVDAFPDLVIRWATPSGAGTGAWRVALPACRSPRELRDAIARVRRGFLRLFARFEPSRHAAVLQALAGFGTRDSLGGLAAADPVGRFAAGDPGRADRPSAERLDGTALPTAAVPPSLRVH